MPKRWMVVIVLMLCAALSIATETSLKSPAEQTKSQPSFVCSKARHEIETMICENHEFITLDNQLADLYKRAEAKNTGEDLKLLKAMQRGWIKGRNDCWKAQDKRQCIIDSYQVRMVELQIRNGLVMAPTAIGYVCNEDHSKPFFASFYNNISPQAVVITYGDDQTIAIATPAASGSKYIAQGMFFWEHHGEASVDWYGNQLVCKPIKPVGQGN